MVSMEQHLTNRFAVSLLPILLHNHLFQSSFFLAKPLDDKEFRHHLSENCIWPLSFQTFGFCALLPGWVSMVGRVYVKLLTLLYGFFYCDHYRGCDMPLVDTKVIGEKRGPVTGARFPVVVAALWGYFSLLSPPSKVVKQSGTTAAWCYRTSYIGRRSHKAPNPLRIQW